MVKIIIGNWKMNKTNDEAIALAKEIAAKCQELKSKTVLCPPNTSLYSVCKIIKNTEIELGAQNVLHKDQGSYTGEVSIDMLENLNVKYIIIGHSERREYFHESDDLISKKFHKILEEKLIPVLCVGETLGEREKKIQKEVVSEQLEKIFDNGLKFKGKFYVAYEPIWAIGTGKTATTEEAEEMCDFIRGELFRLLGRDFEYGKILYGGSVKSDNAKELISSSSIDGALVGGASLKADEFIKIVNFMEAK